MSNPGGGRRHRPCERPGRGAEDARSGAATARWEGGEGGRREEGGRTPRARRRGAPAPRGPALPPRAGPRFREARPENNYHLPLFDRRAAHEIDRCSAASESKTRLEARRVAALGSARWRRGRLPPPLRRRRRRSLLRWRARRRCSCASSRRFRRNRPPTRASTPRPRRCVPPRPRPPPAGPSPRRVPPRAVRAIPPGARARDAGSPGAPHPRTLARV